jgi:hypothetical protein
MSPVISAETAGRGVFKVQPLEGDCVTKPVTGARTADFFFAESFFAR